MVCNNLKKKSAVKRNICKLQPIGQMDGNFKVLNLIHENKNFPEDPFDNHPKIISRNLITQLRNDLDNESIINNDADGDLFLQ